MQENHPLVIDFHTYPNPVIEFFASKENHSIVRSIMTCNKMDSDHYQMVKSSMAFWQSGSENRSGWVMIEIWKADKAEEFRDYLSRFLDLSV